MRASVASEICPTCYLEMIPLADFDARRDAISSGDDSLHHSNYGWWESALILDFLGRVLDKIKAFFFQRKLDRVARRWPNSLLCSHCGHVLKRH